MKAIIIKYLEGRASEDEQQRLLKWVRNKENRLIFNNHRLEWKNSLKKDQLPVGSKEVWNKIQTQLLQRGSDKWRKSKKIQHFLKVAAIIFFIINIGGLAFILSSRNNSQKYFTSVIAENGQISKIELPDGSMVWLNSGSKITYNNNFALENRNVNLDGEAFFQVTKNKKLPLIVNCEGLKVKVLGTHFNVMAYSNCKDVKVVLEEGSVELLNSDLKPFSHKLIPGELGSFDKISKKLSVSKVNTFKYTSWRQGIINIYNQTLEELVERLEVHYSQKFELDDNVKNFHFTFTIRNEPLDEIIELLEKISPIKAIQINNTIKFELDENKMSKIDDKK